MSQTRIETDLMIGTWLAESDHQVAQLVRKDLRDPSPAECQRYYEGNSPAAKAAVENAFWDAGQP